MAKINTLNVRVAGINLKVDASSPSTIDGIEWNPYTEAMTSAQWSTLTGLTARQWINPWDVNSIVFTDESAVSQFTDKSGNGRNLEVLGLANLVKDAGRNVGSIISAFVGSDDLSTYTSGNGFSTSFVVGLCFKFISTPSSKQTLWSIGHSSTGARRSISVTTSGYIEYAYADDSGNTITITGADTVPYGVPCVIWVACERSKVRVYIHGGGLDHKKTISGEGAFNTVSTITEMAIGGYYTAGAVSQNFNDGYYLGHIFADGVCKDTFEALETTCSLFNVGFTTSDASTFSQNLISVIQGPGAGNLAAPRANVVDLIAGTTFTATGTLPTAGDGKFHKALNIAMAASTIYLRGTVPAAWDLFSGSYGNFTLYIRYRTATLDTSTRQIICLNTIAAPTTQNWRIGLSTADTLILNIDNGTTLVTSTVTVANDTWYDIIVKNTGGVYTFAVNGETPITFTPATRSTVGGYFSIGSMATGADTIQHPGRGLLDCLALWNRALSSDEILELRNGGNGRDGFFEYLESEAVGELGDIRYVGTMVAGDGNENYRLQSTSNFDAPTTAQWVTFISPFTGSLREMTMWFKTAPSYGAGTYGTYDLSVRTDNAGAPSSTVISSVAGVTGFTSSSSANSNQYRRITFSTIGSVTAGTKYHLLIRNVAAGASGATNTTNWTSLNAMSAQGVIIGGGNTAARPLWPHTDFMFHHLNNTYLKGTPCLVLGVDTNADNITDKWFGYGGADAIACYTGGTFSNRIGGVNKTRMRVQFSSNFTLVGMAIAAFRTAGTGSVTATLKNIPGTVLATATLPGAQFNQTAAPTREVMPGWSYGLFNANPVLASGTLYYMELSAPSDTFIYPNVHTNTASSVNGGFLATMDGTKGGWWGNSLPLQASTDNGVTWGTYGNGNRSMSFYLSGY
jgi:hypothetical protein